MKKVSCTYCGHSLVIEYVGTYGTIYHVGQFGKIGRMLRSIKYEHSGDTMVYCPSCGANYEHKILNGTLFITGEARD